MMILESQSYLRSVTGAHKLVVGGRPWNNTSQVSAHGIKTITLKCLVVLDNEVSEK